MKVLQSSSRGGRGGGRGRGGGGRGRGRGDERFSARHTDPRFGIATRTREAKNRADEKVARAVRSDPRFAKRLPEPVKHRGQQQHHRQQMDEVSEEDDDEEEEEEDEEQVELQLGEEEALSPEEQQALDEEVAAWEPEETEMIAARKRVAIVNCDWDHVRAVDLYAILFFALPLGGQLHDVSIYLSDFGKKMIDYEKMHGPDLWVKHGEEEEEAKDEDGEQQAPRVEELPDEEAAEDDDGSGDDARSDGWVDDHAAMQLDEEGEGGELFSDGKYRKYEMDRMKYYYAVATFDCAETAAAVYHDLDGMDIEASGVVLDLRYIDDDESFDAAPVSHADAIPPNFRPLASFKSAALSQAKFRISWDQDDVFRHHSVQDSFTGTSTEDDLAAYLAPPDSNSDEDDDGVVGGKSDGTAAKKKAEKMKIRRRYAALLAEIGGIPDEVPDDDDHDGDGDDEEDNDEGSEDDDDSLNRFSDVEMSSNDDDDDDGGDEGDDDEEEFGDMEATLDMDAETKAAGLQRDARLQRRLRDGNLAAKAEVKYKQRRKEVKKAKKQMRMDEREQEKAAIAAERDEQRKKLQKLVRGAEESEEVAQLSGKERRKLHSKNKRQQLAEERAEQKKARLVEKLGVGREIHAARAAADATKALEGLDTRFQSKLLSDPRFQLDVAQKDRRLDAHLHDLASTVVKARQAAKHSRSSTHTTTTSAAADDANAVDFFLNEPSKKKMKRV